jgi:hypothetical protein
MELNIEENIEENIEDTNSIAKNAIYILNDINKKRVYNIITNEENKKKYVLKNDVILFVDAIINNINNLEEVFNDLITCNCCKKHKINRPTNLETWREINNHKSQNVSQCKCQCRHYSRFVYRAFKKQTKIDRNINNSYSCGRSQCEFNCNCD